jgi:hypothetical protein
LLEVLAFGGVEERLLVLGCRSPGQLVELGTRQLARAHRALQARQGLQLCRGVEDPRGLAVRGPALLGQPFLRRAVPLAGPLARVGRPPREQRLQGDGPLLDVGGGFEQTHGVIGMQERGVDRAQQLVECLHHPLQVVQHRKSSTGNEEASGGK